MDDKARKQIIDRLSRAEGQIRSLKATLSEQPEHDCKAFITQIKAARSALKAVSENYVLHHIHHCQHLAPSERDTQISEAVKLLSKD